MKERESDNTKKTVSPKPQTVPVIDGAPPSDQNAPPSGPADGKQDKNERQQANGKAGRPYATKADNKYTFRAEESNQTTSRGFRSRDRLNPQDGA